MTNPATLLTLATLTATAATVLAAALRTWERADRRRDAARAVGVTPGRHTPAEAAHSDTDDTEGDQAA